MSVVISSRYQLEVSTLHWHGVCDSNQEHTHTHACSLSRHSQQGEQQLVNPLNNRANKSLSEKETAHTHTHSLKVCVLCPEILSCLCGSETGNECLGSPLL